MTQDSDPPISASPTLVQFLFEHHTSLVALTDISAPYVAHFEEHGPPGGMVTRSDLRGTAGPAFAGCGMLDAPEYLPNGYYEAIFCGHSAFLHRANGSWSVGVPWRELPPSKTTGPPAQSSQS